MDHSPADLLSLPYQQNTTINRKTDKNPE